MSTDELHSPEPPMLAVTAAPLSNLPSPTPLSQRSPTASPQRLHVNTALTRESTPVSSQPPAALRRLSDQTSPSHLLVENEKKLLAQNFIDACRRKGITVAEKDAVAKLEHAYWLLDWALCDEERSMLEKRLKASQNAAEDAKCTYLKNVSNLRSNLMAQQEEAAMISDQLAAAKEKENNLATQIQALQRKLKEMIPQPTSKLQDVPFSVPYVAKVVVIQPRRIDAELQGMEDLEPAEKSPVAPLPSTTTSASPAQPCGKCEELARALAETRARLSDDVAEKMNSMQRKLIEELRKMRTQLRDEYFRLHRERVNLTTSESACQSMDDSTAQRHADVTLGAPARTIPIVRSPS